ncbi:MAG: hypothetical protein H6Q53_2111, partial [Deltaproteobacteria bacterium]|nr:hypothetical protein [Deltaproteobacteria bacterium]
MDTGVRRNTFSKVTIEGRSVIKSFVPLDNIDSVLSILSKIAIWGGLLDEERSKVFKRLE